jgi:histidinol-phosphate aminotransferase
MSPTPVTFASPTATAAYSWEATDEAVAERYGLPVSEVARFDLNTAPEPPARVAELLAAGRFVVPVSEYPPSDYRALVEVASRRYGVDPAEILVGAGADEILDLIAKAFLPPGAAAVIPAPTYSMYQVLTEQRGARVVPAPRTGPSDGYRLDPDAIRTAAAAAGAPLVWLCSPNNPTGLEEPDGLIAGLLDSLAADAARDRRPAPVVVLDEAYAEFTGRSLVELRDRYPALVVIRTLSKAWGLAGLRVGFALARPEVIAHVAPYRPPGSLSVVSVSVAAEILADDAILDANVERIIAERSRLAGMLRDAGWQVGPSVTNFLLVGFGSAERTAAVTEALLRRGLVPRTFGAGHPLADHLRITVRSSAENDRLAAAARAIETEAPA